MRARRVLVIGLDCVPPSLLFDRFRGVMPNVTALARRGAWGALRSTEPPITVPAWTSMVSGRDPGELGLYGFRNRTRDGGYTLRVATSRDVRAKRLWDLLGEAGKRVAALFVPLTSPPSPLRGQMVAGFLTPAPERGGWAWPPALERELTARFGPYLADVEGFRTDAPGAIVDALERMAEQHFAIAEHVWVRERPDFMMMVEIGPDRLHHALWQHLDPSHPAHDPESPWGERGRAYYAALDRHIGRLVGLADDDTAVLIASDHGAKPLLGGVCVNDWLIANGWLHLERTPRRPARLADADLRWEQTRAWGEGGYYARVCLNVEGREPRGCVPPREYERTRAALAEALAAIRRPDGAAMRTRVVLPERAYRAVRGRPPDLMVYFDDLDYRAIGTVGHGAIHVADNDTGHDTCNHDWDGVWVLAGAGVRARGRIEGAAIYDVTRTVLALMGVDGPPDLLGVDRSQ